MAQQEQGQEQESGVAEHVKTCHVCGATSTSCCSKCKSTRYCSVACQKADWAAHKKLCGKPQVIHAEFGPGETASITVSKTAAYRAEMYNFKLQFIEQHRLNNPGWEPNPDDPILSWERSYWESEHNKVGYIYDKEMCNTY
jgi:hypothetical protein